MPTVYIRVTRSNHLLRHLTLICAVLLLTALGGCGFNKSGVVIPEMLETVGWQRVPDTLAGCTFKDYAARVGGEVLAARVPFVPENHRTEAGFAAPAEFKPADHCEQTHGIAVLVHGLSDSAFSMRDFAQLLATHCYLARTALLPGHGTRPGDLLQVRLQDWAATVDYLIKQAAAEHDHVVVAGFSLGALLTLTHALNESSAVDVVVSLSPAFYLSTSPWADLTKYLYPLRTWLDKEKPDDTYRYEAIPTVAVAQTVKAKDRFHRTLKRRGTVTQPWLIIQSEEDLVIDTHRTRELFTKASGNDVSRVITYYGSADELKEVADSDARLINLAGYDEKAMVSGLTHVAIHQSPDNHHYGVNGAYRNCGSGGPRPRPEVHQCEQAQSLWLGPWDKSAPDGGPYGVSTYNPRFDELSHYVGQFLESVRAAGVN